MSKQTPEETAARDAARDLLHNSVKVIMDLESFDTLETLYNGKLENIDRDFDLQIKHLNKLRDELKSGKKTVKMYGYWFRGFDFVLVDLPDGTQTFKQIGPVGKVTLVCDYEMDGKLMPPLNKEECDRLVKQDSDVSKETP